MIKFTKTHEWADIDADVAKIGISEYAAEEMGDIVYIALPEIGAAVNAGETLCEIESVKAVSEVLSPVKGTVIEVNQELETSPELINRSPMSAWIAKIRYTELSDGLLGEEEYLAVEK